MGLGDAHVIDGVVQRELGLLRRLTRPGNNTAMYNKMAVSAFLLWPQDHFHLATAPRVPGLHVKMNLLVRHMFGSAGGRGVRSRALPLLTEQ